MRKLSFAALLTTLLAIFLHQPVSATTETLHFSSHGEFAEAAFVSTDETGCVETDVRLAVVDRLVKEDGSPRALEARVLISLFQQDVCAGTVLINAFGSADLGRGQYTMSRVESANLVASLPVEDAVSGSTFTLDISLAWQATGIIVRHQERSIFHTPDRKVVTRIACTGSGCLGRGATVSGVISDGTTNFAPVAGGGVIGQAKIGQAFIDKS